MTENVVPAETPEEKTYFDSQGQQPLEKPEPPPEKDTLEMDAEFKQEEKPQVRKVVPLAALHEERKARQALEKQAQEWALERQRYSERMSKLEQMFQQQNAPKAPEKDQDPIGYFDHKTGNVESDLKATKEQLNQLVQQQTQAQREQQFMQWYSNQAREFVKEAPDFGDAYEHFITSWKEEIAEYGLSDPNIALAELRRIERQIVETAARSGLNPARAIYNAAKKRGYGGKKASDAEKMETLQKGTQAAKSLTGGGSPENPPSVKDLLEMSDEDFDKNFDKVMNPRRR